MAKEKGKTKEEKKALQENDDRLDLVELQHENIKNLYALAKKLGVDDYKQLKKSGPHIQDTSSQNRTKWAYFCQGLPGSSPGWVWVSANQQLPPKLRGYLCVPNSDQTLRSVDWRYCFRTSTASQNR